MESETLIPMAGLAKRWTVTPNTVSRRLAFLGIKPERQGNHRFITVEQQALADELHNHILSGKPMEAFPRPDQPEGGQVARQVRRGGQVAGQVDQDAMARLLGGLLQAQGGVVPPSPLARARAMRAAATEGLRLTTAELAELTGRSVVAIDRMRSGSRLQGYRVWRVPGAAADPEVVWQLSEASGPRAIGDPRRSPGRDGSSQ